MSYNTHVTMTLSSDDRERLNDYARYRGLSASQLLRDYISTLPTYDGSRIAEILQGLNPDALKYQHGILSFENVDVSICRVHDTANEFSLEAMKAVYRILLPRIIEQAGSGRYGWGIVPVPTEDLLHAFGIDPEAASDADPSDALIDALRRAGRYTCVEFADGEQRDILDVVGTGPGDDTMYMAAAYPLHVADAILQQDRRRGRGRGRSLADR